MAVNTSEEKVVLTAEDKFSAVFKTAQRSVDGMKQSLDAVKGGLAAIGVTVGAGAILNMYYDTLKATAALDDMAESTGASVEMLSAIQRVGRVAGADFDGLTGQISKMIKGLKQGGEEGTKAGAAFAFLDIKTKDANGRFRDTGEIVIELAQKLSKYEDGGNKVALVQDALGKGAERYLPLLKDIAEGTDLHATVTAKQAAQAEIAEKNIKRLTLVMEDGRKELVNSYTPAIIEFTEKLLLASKASGGLAAGLATMATAKTDDIAARLKEIESLVPRLEKVASDREFKYDPKKDRYSNAMAEANASVAQFFDVGGKGAGVQVVLLKQEQEYLETLLAARQKSAAKAGAIDPNSPLFEFGGEQKLNYQSPDTKKDRQRLSPYESAALELQQGTAKARLGADSETYSVQLAIEAGKYGELNEAQKTRLVQLAAERDVQKYDMELKKETTAIMEAQGEKELRIAEQRRAELDQLRASTMDQVDVENEAYKRRLESVQKFSDAEIAANGGAKAIAEQMESDHMQRLLEIDRNKHAAQRSMEMTTAQLGAELLQQFAGKSKAAAIAVLAINKGLAIAQVIVNTQAAVARGYAELGVYAGTANAAYMEGLMAVQIGLIAATGLIEASNVGSGGASPGSPANPVNTTGGGAGAGAAALAQQAPAAPQTTIIQFSGSTSDESLIRRFVELLNQNSRDGGQILVT